MLLVSSCVPVIIWLCSPVMRFQSRPTNWPLLTIVSGSSVVIFENPGAIRRDDAIFLGKRLVYFKSWRTPQTPHSLVRSLGERDVWKHWAIMLSCDVTPQKPGSGSGWLPCQFIRPTRIIWIILLPNFVCSLKMAEDNCQRTPQDLKPFLVYARHLGLKTSIRNKKRHLQNFLVEAMYS